MRDFDIIYINIYIYMLGVSNLHAFIRYFDWNFETVLMVWYFLGFCPHFIIYKIAREITFLQNFHFSNQCTLDEKNHIQLNNPTDNRMNMTMTLFVFLHSIFLMAGVN